MTASIQPDQGSYRLPSIEHATVADAMRTGVMTCEPDTAAVAVARMMSTHHIHAVVVEGIRHDHGQGERLVWGVISDTDLIHAIDQDNDDLTAGELAATEPVTVQSSLPLHDAIRLMQEHEITHLIVTDGQRPVGVLSTLDVAGILAWGRG